MTLLSRLTRHGSPVGLIDRARSHSRRVLPCLERLEQRTVMTAIASPPVYQNPFMAPNNVSEIHLNAYQTDTFSTLGPASAPSQTVQERLIWPPSQIAGTIAVNSSGQILTIRVGPSPTSSGTSSGDETLLLIDPVTLKVLAEAILPNRPSDNGTVSFTGGGYFYLNNLDQVVCVTANQQIRIYSVQNDQFALDQTYDLSAAINNSSDILNSVLPDSSGNLWFITEQGDVGYVNPTTGSINITNIRDVPGANPSETDTKSFATDGQGGVYVVSDYALYRFQVGSNGAPQDTCAHGLRSRNSREARAESDRFGNNSDLFR